MSQGTFCPVLAMATMAEKSAALLIFDRCQSAHGHSDLMALPLAPRVCPRDADEPAGWPATAAGNEHLRMGNRLPWRRMFAIGAFGREPEFLFRDIGQHPCDL